MENIPRIEENIEENIVPRIKILSLKKKYTSEFKIKKQK